MGPGRLPPEVFGSVTYDLYTHKGQQIPGRFFSTELSQAAFSLSQTRTRGEEREEGSVYVHIHHLVCESDCIGHVCLSVTLCVAFSICYLCMFMYHVVL